MQQKLTDAIASSDNETKLWKARFSAARAAYDAAEFRQCQSLLHRALEQAQKLKEREFAINTCLIGLGAVSIALGQLDEADKQLEKVIRALSSSGEPALQELYGVALRFHADVMFEKGDPDTAERELRQAMDVLEKIGTEGAVQLSYALSDLATMYVKQGKLHDAKELLASAMGLLEIAVGPDDPEYTRANVIYSICQAKDEDFLVEVENSIVRMRYERGEKHPSMMKALRWYLKKLYECGDKERIAEAELKFGVNTKR